MRRLHTYGDFDGDQLLEVAPHAHLTDQGERQYVRQEARRLSALLARKGIRYDDLAPALVPNQRNRDIVFFFDVELTESSSYGTEAGRALIDTLTTESTHCVATGDLLNPWVRDLRTIFASMEIAEGYRGRALDCYGVYLTNVKPKCLARMHRQLSRTGAYAGLMDCTWEPESSRYFSTVLHPRYLKHHHMVISAHEDDVPAEEDCYVGSWPWPATPGYQCPTVPENLMRQFLTGRIPQPATPGFAINEALTAKLLGSSAAVDQYRASVDASMTAATGRPELESTVLPLLDPGEVADLILERIERGYIYSLADETDDSLTFQVILAVDQRGDDPPRRIMFDVQYWHGKRRLELTALS